MSPLEIEILLHYYCIGGEYRDGDHSAPAVRDALDSFVEVDGLLTRITESDLTIRHEITARGRAHVEALKSLPLPIQIWVTPKDSPCLNIKEIEKLIANVKTEGFGVSISTLAMLEGVVIAGYIGFRTTIAEADYVSVRARALRDAIAAIRSLKSQAGE